MEKDKLKSILKENDLYDLEGIEIENSENFVSAGGNHVVVADKEYVSEVKQALSDAGYESNDAFYITDEWGKYVVSVK